MGDLEQLKSVKIAISEAISRLKICTVINSYFDELADVEQTTAKGLSKIQKITIGGSNSPKLLASTIVAWDAIHKFITLRGGKYGPVPVPILSNNPSKAYPEFAKTNKKKLQSLTNKIMASIDDMRKAKVAHQKNIDQYHRMITEAEGLIKTRDSVGEGEMAPIQDGVGKDDTFMNRSFTKMFTKNTPNDKKERLRDLIREIDVAESQIRANATRLNNCRNSLIDELSKAWEEVNATETRRLNTFKEGITVFTLTWNSWTESKKQCMATVLEAIENVSLDDSIKNFISEIDTVQPFPVLQDTDGAMDYAPSEVGDYFAQLYSRIDKISDNLEKIKIFASKSVQLLQDAADLHHACGKSIYKVFEKYGFRQSNPMEVSDQRNLVEVFGTKDSPLIANAWLKWSALYGETVEFNFRNADFYVDNLCQKLTLAQRSVEQQKKNLVEKNFAYAKRHETIQGTYVKLLTKLNKVQKDLNERKSALKKAKEDLDTGNPSTTTAAITDLPGTDASPDKTADESGDWKLSLDDSSVVVTEETESTSATGDATEKKKNASNMMQNLSSSLRSRKLSAVVGFESPEDRISRIEVKVLALEEEEKELILGMESTVVEMNNLLKEAIRELAANCQLAQDYMLSDLSTVRTVLNSLRDWHQKEIKQDIDIVAIASTLCDRIDISHDLNIFQQVINDKYKEAATIDTSLIADIPAIEVFEAYSSTALDEERRIYVANAHRESPARRSRSGTDVEASPAELVGGEAHKSTTSETSELRDGSIESKAVQSLSLVEEKDEYDREDPDVDFDSNREALFSREDEENEIDTKANVNVTETSLNASSLEDRERISSIPDDLESLDPRNTTNSVASTDTRRSKRVVSVRNTLITPPQKMDSGTLSELHKFGLDANDKVIESFSCALYPKKGLLTHGRLFITQRYMAFSGWPDTRVLLPLKYLDSIEKTNTLYYIPNAISVVMNDQEKFFFGSFIDRDYCYNLLKNMSEVEKRMIEIHGEDILRDLRSLQFGFLGKKDVEIIPASPTDMKDANLAPSDAQTNPTDTNQSDTNEFERKDSFNLDNDQPDSVFVPDPEDDTIDFSTVYNTSGITVLLDKSLDSSPLELWSCCWLYGNGYCDFLQSQGDLQIHFEEWQSFQKTVAEDVAKLPFTFTRKVTYSHPRTTMLMFGPKYAPSSQEQYLYLPCLSKGKSTKFADLQECKPGRGIILTITQLDGIPMSDVFRVLQYWSFEFEPSSNMKTKVRSGVALHYLKSSMFKGQIFSGVKDELTEQVQKWLQYAEMRLKDFLNQVEDEQNFVERASSYSFDDNSAITSAVARRRYSGIANMPRQMPKSVLPAAPEIETAPVHIPTAAANAGPVETGHVLLFLVGVLLFILFVQWMANRGLVYQIDLLNRKIEANQKMIEAVIAETQQILEKVSSLNQN